MRKSFTEKIVTMGVVILLIINFNSMSVSAIWEKDNEKECWNWIEENNKVVGWKKVNDKWYHFDENGAMNTGWLMDDEKWYKLSDDGSMTIGWIQENGKWYYANISGDIEIGTITIDGETYTFLEDGSMLDKDSIVQEQAKDPLLSQESKTSEDIGKAYVNTNSEPLNVRSDASISSSIIGTLARGSEINILSKEENGFYSIIFDGKNAWVSASWISFEKPLDLDKSNEANPIIKIDDKEDEFKNIILKDDSLGKGTVRTKEPSLDNMYYYSDSNIFYKVRLSPPFTNSSGNPIKGNCTWYAWGRAWEITGQKPTEAGFNGNAYEWWEANKNSGKYKYGAQPKVGSIAVWKSNLPGSGDCGHVAIVEEIINGKIYISESMWHGDCFKYKEIYNTDYLYGYIYLDEPNY